MILLQEKINKQVSNNETNSKIKANKISFRNFEISVEEFLKTDKELKSILIK